MVSLRGRNEAGFDHYHIYTLVQEEGEYRIVPGQRFTGCKGYILSRKSVYIGDDGILLKNETIPYLRSSKENNKNIDDRALALETYREG